jgi:exopolysaccharide production protein ExoQ
MPPTLATLLWLLLLLLLLRFDPARDPEASSCLWLPVIWLSIAGSRLPSQWLGIQSGSLAQALEEGNSLDRTIECLVILLAIGILVSRSFRWHDLFARNIALMAFLSFALFSVLWSDFAWVSFKHWFRDLGNYVVILVALSDPRPVEAVRTLLRRVAYLLIPLSILLIKYYPYLGIHYDEWTGMAAYVGASTSKNMLGALCLVSGIFFFWDLVTHWPNPNQQRGRWIFVNFSFIVMTLWLLLKSHSATSAACFVLGCLVIAAAHTKSGQRHPTVLKLAIPACFVVYLILGFGFGLNEQLAAMMGRDPTLTGRTKIWGTLLAMDTNPLVGTGYGSFWLGSRLNSVWELRGRITESHNGYLEMYLNLGIIGLLLFVVFLIAAYGSICKKQLTSKKDYASLALALWTVLLFYMVTEAGFRGGLLSVVFLLVVISVPANAESETTAFEEIEHKPTFDSDAVLIANENI